MALQLSPRDDLVIFGSLRREKDTAREAANVFLGPDDERIIENENMLGFAFWTHAFADQNNITFGAGRGTEDSLVNFTSPVSNGRRQSIFTENTDFAYATAQYARRWENLDIKLGVEGYWNDVHSEQFEFVILPNGRITNRVQRAPTEDTTFNDVRLYVDGRWRIGEKNDCARAVELS